MDARPSARAKEYAWSTVLLDSVNLEASDLGLSAWIRSKQYGGERDIYLPLALGTDQADTTEYRLTIVPGQELAEVYLSIERQDGNGDQTQVVEGKALGFGYYPAERALTIPLQIPAESGVYRVEIGAQLRYGGVRAKTLLLFHSAEPLARGFSSE
jgi:hypothetical protein